MTSEQITWTLKSTKRQINRGDYKAADRTLNNAWKAIYDSEAWQEESIRALQKVVTDHVALTYEQLMDLALKNYNKGGDSTYECWEEKDYQEHGPLTYYGALRMFERDFDIVTDMLGW